jgi:hypothetical protein
MGSQILHDLPQQTNLSLDGRRVRQTFQGTVRILSTWLTIDD